MSPKVDFPISIILISYNNFQYIFEALDSIFIQSYPNIQLIISDDASEKFDLKMLEKYIKKHRTPNISDIRININAQNMGTVKHLEYVRKMCSGELITIIAADDAFADEFAICHFAEEYITNDKKIGVITSLLAMCGTDLRDIKSIFTSDADVELINSGDSLRLFEELSYRCIMPSSGTAITPAVYKQIGDLSENYKFVEDWSAHLRMVRMQIPIKCIKHITVLHREGGVSHGNKRANQSVYLDYYKDLLNLYVNEVQPYLSTMSKQAAYRAEKFYNWRCNRYKKDIDEAASYTNKRKIVFFFRKGVIAKGDFALFYRIGEYIANNTDYEVFCVNNSNPEIQKEYLESKIHFCNITSTNIKCFEDAIFVASYNQLFFLLEEIKELNKARMILLFMHPQINKWMSLQLSMHNKTKKFLKLLKKNDAYGLMDKANLLATQRHNEIELEDRYFPVVFNEAFENYEEPKLVENNMINIAWFGRLDGDKIYSFTNFLDNLIGFEFGMPITVHLIGDGNAKKLIDISKYSPQMRFVFNSYLYGEEKNKYLRENVDIVVAMGICALDAASLKIPTILPIVTSHKSRSNKFIWLCETKDFTLGTDEEDIVDLGCKTHTADYIIRMIYSENKKSEIGERCFLYAKENFTLEKNAQEYLNLIENTSLTVNKCKRHPFVLNQILSYRMYKFIRRGRTYSDFLLFRQKVNSFLNLPMRTKIKNVLLYIEGRFYKQ